MWGNALISRSKMPFFFCFWKYCLQPTHHWLALGAIKLSRCLASRQKTLYDWLADIVKNIKSTVSVLSQCVAPCYPVSFSKHTECQIHHCLSSCLCQSSCSLYVSARPAALYRSGVLLTMCDSVPLYLFQATWRQRCRTRKVLNTTRARLTLLPPTARWK